MVTVQLAQRRGAGIVFRLFRARCQEAPTLTEPVTDAHGSQPSGGRALAAPPRSSFPGIAAALSLMRSAARAPGVSGFFCGGNRIPFQSSVFGCIEKKVLIAQGMEHPELGEIVLFVHSKF